MNEQQSQSMESQSGHVNAPSRRPVADSRPTSGDHRMYATLAHLLGIVSGPIGPFVIWLVMKGDSQVEPQAREALNFQITVWLVTLLGAVLTVVYIGGLIIILAMVFNVVFCVIAASHAHSGMPYRYPICLRLIDSAV